MSEGAIGTNGEKVILFYACKDEKDFKTFKESSEKLMSPAILTSSTYVIFLSDESQRATLPDLARINYISKSSYNFLGQLKDKNVKDKLNQKYDVLIAFNDMDTKQTRLINKIKTLKRIVVSQSKGLKYDIRLSASSNRIEQIASFAKETLQKIQS